MSRPPVSLQTRLIAASAVLAVLVIGVFAAMVLAVSAAGTAADQEARSRNVTTSALQLEKLLLDLEAGAEVMDQICERHLDVTPSRGSRGDRLRVLAKRDGTSSAFLSEARRFALRSIS